MKNQRLKTDLLSWLAAGFFFCPDDSQAWRRGPFYQAGAAIAATHCYMVRIPGLECQAVHGAPDIQFLDWSVFDRLDYAAGVLVRPVDLVPYVNGICPECPGKFTLCRECEGEGTLQFESDFNSYMVTCQSCYGSGDMRHRFKDPAVRRVGCDDCHGTGLEFLGDFYLSENRRIRPAYLYLMARAYGWIKLFPAAVAGDRSPVPFVTANQGQGFIMPLKYPGMDA